jgi:hypothetical protein
MANIDDWNVNREDGSSRDGTSIYSSYSLILNDSMPLTVNESFRNTDPPDLTIIQHLQYIESGNIKIKADVFCHQQKKF